MNSMLPAGSHITICETRFVGGCYKGVEQEREPEEKEAQRGSFENTRLGVILLKGTPRYLSSYKLLYYKLLAM